MLSCRYGFFTSPKHTLRGRGGGLSFHNRATVIIVELSHCENKPFSVLSRCAIKACPPENIQTIYLTVAWRYEFYFRVVKTIFYEWAHRVTKILFSPWENKIHIFTPPHYFLFIIKGSLAILNRATVGNDIIDILTSEDMEICHSGPRCSFVWVLHMVLFSSKTLVST